MSMPRKGDVREEKIERFDGRVVASDLVKSYRMLTYTAGAKPVVRVEILLSQGVEPRLERRDSQELMLSVSRNDQGAPKAAVTGPAPSLQPAPS